MADLNGQYTTGATLDMSVDAGLRKFMLGVYNKMALGLLLTAAISWTVANYQPVSQFFFVATTTGFQFTLLGIAAQWAPLVIILGSMLIKNVTPRSASILYWTIVSLIGVSGAFWFMRYQLGSIAEVFLITASSFGVLSLVGYTTKIDLKPIGSFLIMAMWGLLIVGLVNAFFIRSEGLSLIASVAGVVIFAGLIAYDTQRLKGLYYQMGGNEAGMNVATSMGALSLYLDFINLFQFLLNLLGSRR